jgi:hypothetical protein
MPEYLLSHPKTCWCQTRLFSLLMTLFQCRVSFTDSPVMYPHSEAPLYLPMVFIGEAEQPTRNTSLLQDIEKRQTLRDGKTIVQVAVDNELWSSELLNMLWGRRVEPTIVLSVVPERAVELWKSVYE